MASKLFPIVQFKKDTWEIDEFDCMSMFLIIGSEKALLLDCGIGVGDIVGAVKQITDKPVILAATHGHLDHIGGAYKFDEIWINPKDKDQLTYKSAEERSSYPKTIAVRQHGCLPAVYHMHNLYAYDPATDMEDQDPSKPPVVHDLVEGMEFDLGGRVIKVYECPGHTPGQLMFLDESTRSLFVGDALNYNLGIRSVPVETALKSLEKMEALKDKYDGIYNSHHDFRALGMPLGDDCLPNAISICRRILSGKYNLCTVPNFMGAGRPNVEMVLEGRNYIGFSKDKIFE